MDSRGNMSSQHRRSKVNHSVIMGPELNEAQERMQQSRKRLNKMTAEELNLCLEVCRLQLAYWKNRRPLRKKWEESIDRIEKEIKKRQ